MSKIADRFKSLTELQKKIYLKSFALISVFLLTIVLLFTITAAWYSNIAEVEELTFEVDSWGVDCTIMLDDETILKVAPGDSEAIPFKVDNRADRMVNVQFNAYKKYLPSFMQQRIYFYIDDEAEVNGETLDRIYLHDDNAYYYSLVGGQVVDNTAEIISNAKLKWEWVYDLLGYYTIIQTDDEDFCTETAYIRPVEYKYENADYDLETGKLTSITMDDGTVITGDEFIAELLATDGFILGRQTEDGFEQKDFSENDQRTEQTEEDDDNLLTSDEIAKLETVLKFKDIAGDEIEKTYYEIYVDEVAGYGIYMYLCDYNEIVVNNKVDTAIGNGSKLYEITEEHFAAIQVSCGQAIEYYIEITDPVQLKEVLEDNQKYTELLENNNLLAEKSTVVLRLNADMTIDPVKLAMDGCDIIIDLNGYTLTNSTQGAAMFTLNPGCSLRVLHGTINPAGGVPFLATGATVVLRNVKTETTGAAVTIDTNGWQQGSNIQLVNCTWAEGRQEDAAAIIEVNAEDNVPSFTYINEITEEVDASRTDETGADTGEVTE